MNEMNTVVLHDSPIVHVPPPATIYLHDTLEFYRRNLSNFTSSGGARAWRRNMINTSCTPDVSCSASTVRSLCTRQPSPRSCTGRASQSVGRCLRSSGGSYCCYTLCTVLLDWVLSASVNADCDGDHDDDRDDELLVMLIADAATVGGNCTRTVGITRQWTETAASPLRIEPAHIDWHRHGRRRCADAARFGRLGTHPLRA